MAKCKRCPALGRSKPNETGKTIDGVPICSECMLEDARNNRNRVMDYSGLAEQPKVEAKVTKSKKKK